MSMLSAEIARRWLRPDNGQARMSTPALRLATAGAVGRIPSVVEILPSVPSSLCMFLVEVITGLHDSMYGPFEAEHRDGNRYQG